MAQTIGTSFFARFFPVVAVFLPAVLPLAVFPRYAQTSDAQVPHPQTSHEKTAEPIVSRSAPEPVLLRQRLSRERLYPQQPFEVIVELYLAEVPGNRLELDPFTRSRAYQDGKPPVLVLPWVDENTLARDIRSLSRSEVWLNAIPQGEFGFSINGLLRGGYLDERLIFRPEGEKIHLRDEGGGEHPYWKYTLARPYVAQREGAFRFESGEFSGVFLGGNDDGSPAGKSVRTKSAPIDYRVLAVPDGPERPANDLGLFGVFHWKVDLNPKTAKVGEPLTLTITFSGVGSIQKIRAPDLAGDARIADVFRVYRPTEELFADTCRYIYAIRPKRAGTVVFPGLDFSYFHVETERFEALKSDPIATTIHPSEFLAESDVTVSANASRPYRDGIEKTAGGIFANMRHSSGAANRRVDSQASFFCFGTVGLVFCLIVLLYGGRRRFRDRRSLPSRPSTISRAKSRIIRLRSLLNEGKQHECCVKTLAILIEFAAEIEGIPSHDLTPHDVMAILHRWSHDSDRVAEVGRYFDALEAVRYGTRSSRDASETALRGLTILDTMIQLVPKKPAQIEASVASENPPENRGFQGRFAGTIVVTLALFCGCSPRPSPEQIAIFSEALRLYEEAEAMQPATTPEGETSKTASPAAFDPFAGQTTRFREERQKNAFRKSAAMYQDMIDRGIESGAIFYNQGNAWFRAGEPARALASYRMAQRYMPADAYLRSNIRAVMPPDVTEAEQSFFSRLFFWQDILPYFRKMQIAFYLVLATFLFAVAGLPQSNRKCRKIATVLTVLTCVWLVSVFYDWHRFERSRYGVVLVEEAIARKGNSTQYAPAFVEPLKQCREFRVLQERGNWVRFRLSDGQDAWLHRNEIVLYGGARGADVGDLPGNT